MNKKTIQMLGRMSASEIRKGRYMRNPDESGHGGAGGGATQAGSGDNGGGSGGDSSQGAGGGSNNGGQGFDFSGFWDQSAGDSQGGDSQQGQQGQGNESGQSNGGGNAGQQIAQQIDSLKFGQVFTDEVANQIADGNLQGVNDSLNKLGQDITRQSLILNANMMRQFGEKLMSQVQQMVEGSFGSRDDDAALSQTFASMADPAIRPIIKGVFQQSLKHTKGDRAKAIEMTKGMMQFMGTKGASDMGLNIPPTNRENYSSDGASSLVEDLLSGV